MFEQVSSMNNIEFSPGPNSDAYSGGVISCRVPGDHSMLLDPCFVNGNDLDTCKSIVKKVLT